MRVVCHLVSYICAWALWHPWLSGRTVLALWLQLLDGAYMLSSYWKGRALYGS